MDALDLDRALDLARTRGGNRVTVFMPTRPFGPGSQEEDATRLKNLLRAAEEDLARRGVKAAAVEELLAPARALLDDRPFWLRADNGLAVLLGPEGMHMFRLRWPLQESVRVADRYQMRPLLPFVDAGSTFWLLAISQKRVRLFEGSRTELAEVPAEGIPASLAAAMQWDDFEKSSLQFHSGTSSTGGRRPAVFHGTGQTEVKDELVRYFRAIDRGLHDHLRGSDAPLILAGVDYLLPIYREVSTYAHLTEEAITGNPDALAPTALQSRALAIIDARAEEERKLLAAQAEEAWGSPRTTPDPEMIVPAAHHGRIQTLMLTDAEHWWGVYDAVAGHVAVHQQPANGDEDLLDLAALQTLENGGSVVSLSPDEMPHGAAAVALLRY